MNKKALSLLLFPFLLISCSGAGDNTSSSSGGGEGEIIPTPEDGDEYDAWLNSWSKPGHLYFHYNRGDKKEYENYCLWLWQHAPQDLEGALWAFSGNPKVSDKLTLQPMSDHWMTVSETGAKEGDATYIDKYGVIADVDLYASGLVDGKTGGSTSYEGAEELGFLLPRQDSMDGSTNWVSDGGRETYIEDYAESENWRDVEGGKAIHIFTSTGALDEYTYFAGDGVPQAKTNPIDLDTTGNYRSNVDAAYSNKLGNSSTSNDFKDLGVGYQIFVASFRDSDGDGLGDIRGVIDALPYLKELGVQVLWLTPIQASDSYHGYDIKDYYAVDKKFGTIQDYQELIYKAHKQYGMKVLMDLVLNHTSKSNRWFINSQWGIKDPGTGIEWRDVYTWKYETDLIDKYIDGQYKKITVKEDAESKNPSWYRDGESHYYYYGKFGSGMPEINYLSSATRKLVIDMARYWLSFGLDGFRLDAVKHIFMRDECYQNNDVIIPDVGSSQSYDTEKGEVVTKYFDYSSNLTKNIMWWKEFAMGVKSVYPNCFLVGENFDGWGTRTGEYYKALDSQFDFGTYYHIASQIYAPEGKGGVGSFGDKHPKETYDVFGSNAYFPLGDTGITVQGGCRGDFIDGNFTSNHDVMRAINQVNWTSWDATNGTVANDNITGTTEQVNKAKIHAAVTLLGSGVSWIYYGDELGMSSNTIDHAKYKVEKNNIDIWYRQPFLWKDTSIRPDYKAGMFKFELDNYNKTVKPMEDQTGENDMLHWYKELIKIKKEYPRDAKVTFTWGTNVLVIKAEGRSGDTKKVCAYINVGNLAGDYSTNPGDLIGGTTPITSLGGAPTTIGANVGLNLYSVVAFKNM